MQLPGFLVRGDDQAADDSASKKRSEQKAAQVAGVAVQLLQVFMLKQHPRPELGPDKFRRATRALDGNIGIGHA